MDKKDQYRYGKNAFAYSKTDAFQTFDWEKALPDPVVAIKQIGQLLALV